MPSRGITGAANFFLPPPNQPQTHTGTLTYEIRNRKQESRRERRKRAKKRTKEMTWDDEKEKERRETIINREEGFGRDLEIGGRKRSRRDKRLARKICIAEHARLHNGLRGG